MADLTIIPYTAVEAALAQEKEDLREQRKYNTNFHSHEEIITAFPYIQHFSPDQRPWILLSPWLDLILTSRGIQETDVHRIQLPGTFLVHMKYASKVGLHMGHINPDDADDLAHDFPKTTTRGETIETLIKQSRYFVRLDTCSLKDSLIGEGPVKSTRDLWMRLATSARGTTGIRNLQDEDISTPIYMYLFPWQDELRTELEYRIYCPPNTGKIAAISQYKWHAPWHHADDSIAEASRVTQRLVKSCEGLHKRIMAHPAMTDLLRSRGFVFDVVEDPETQDVRLIELNDFGAMSGCGACLFQWIRDARVMYGIDERIEVRVTV